MSEPVDHPTHHLGRRGAFLLIAASVWTLTGLQVYTSPAEGTGLIHQELPLWLRVGVWVIPAAAAAWFAPKRFDWPAFVLLLPAPLIRMVSYGWGWVTWTITDGAEGMARGWSFAAASLAMTAWVLLAAGWAEPVPVLPPDDGEEGDR